MSMAADRREFWVERDANGMVGLVYKGNTITGVTPQGAAWQAGLTLGMVMLIVGGKRVTDSTNTVAAAFAEAGPRFSVVVAMPKLHAQLNTPERVSDFRHLANDPIALRPPNTHPPRPYQHFPHPAPPNAPGLSPGTWGLEDLPKFSPNRPPGEWFAGGAPLAGGSAAENGSSGGANAVHPDADMRKLIALRAVEENRRSDRVEERLASLEAAAARGGGGGGSPGDECSINNVSCRVGRLEDRFEAFSADFKQLCALLTPPSARPRDPYCSPELIPAEPGVSNVPPSTFQHTLHATLAGRVSRIEQAIGKHPYLSAAPNTAEDPLHQLPPAAAALGRDDRSHSSHCISPSLSPTDALHPTPKDERKETAKTSSRFREEDLFLASNAHGIERQAAPEHEARISPRGGSRRRESWQSRASGPPETAGTLAGDIRALAVRQAAEVERLDAALRREREAVDRLARKLNCSVADLYAGSALESPVMQTRRSSRVVVRGSSLLHDAEKAEGDRGPLRSLLPKFDEAEWRVDSETFEKVDTGGRMLDEDRSAKLQPQITVSKPSSRRTSVSDAVRLSSRASGKASAAGLEEPGSEDFLPVREAASSPSEPSDASNDAGKAMKWQVLRELASLKDRVSDQGASIQSNFAGLESVHNVLRQQNERLTRLEDAESSAHTHSLPHSLPLHDVASSRTRTSSPLLYQHNSNPALFRSMDALTDSQPKAVSPTRNGPLSSKHSSDGSNLLAKLRRRSRELATEQASRALPQQSALYRAYAALG
ncbi:hypothetical protein DIPPA_21698 [Diplonema papillatum]|nr:hypothetical protein DIPPA_21698 [Diplonema papillatum]